MNDTFTAPIVSADEAGTETVYSATLQRFLVEPPSPRRSHGRPQKTRSEKEKAQIVSAALLLDEEWQVQLMFMNVLSGKRKIPERLRKEGWVLPDRLNQVETARVLAILHGTEYRTEENKLARAHSLYRSSNLLREIVTTPLFAMVDAKPARREILKKYFGITPRPSARKRKITTTA